MPGMANRVINDQKYPVGTVVSVYPDAAAHDGGPLVGAPGSGANPVESQTVDSSQNATFSALVDGVAYVAHAAVDGVDRYIHFRQGSVFNPALFPTWKARVAARRAAMGTS